MASAKTVETTIGLNRERVVAASVGRDIAAKLLDALNEAGVAIQTFSMYREGDGFTYEVMRDGPIDLTYREKLVSPGSALAQVDEAISQFVVRVRDEIYLRPDGRKGLESGH